MTRKRWYPDETALAGASTSIRAASSATTGRPASTSVAMSRELLRPGGVLRLRDLVFGFGPDEADRSIARWLDAATDNPEDGWTREELETHLREEYSTFTWLLEPMIERAGFEIVRAAYGELRVHADYICRRPAR